MFQKSPVEDQKGTEKPTYVFFSTKYTWVFHLPSLDSKSPGMFMFHPRWCPNVINCFINPMNTIDISHIYHLYITYISHIYHLYITYISPTKKIVKLELFAPPLWGIPQTWLAVFPTKPRQTRDSAGLKGCREVAQRQKCAAAAAFGKQSDVGSRKILLTLILMVFFV